jgi:hypothetical protein
MMASTCTPTLTRCEVVAGAVVAPAPLICTVRCVAGSENTTATGLPAAMSAATCADCRPSMNVVSRRRSVSTMQPSALPTDGISCASRVAIDIDVTPAMNLAVSTSSCTPASGAAIWEPLLD